VILDSAVRPCDASTLNLGWWSYHNCLEPLVAPMWQSFHRHKYRDIQGVVLLRYQVGGHFVHHRDVATAPTIEGSQAFWDHFALSAGHSVQFGRL
jgi:hypothetical protein